MILLFQIFAATFAGIVFGFLQSFVVGLFARSWSGGIGAMWGLIIAVPSAVSAVWAGWYAIILALILASLTFVLSAFSIYRDHSRPC